LLLDISRQKVISKKITVWISTASTTSFIW